MNTKSQHKKQAEATLADSRWAAILARDSQADGTFVYAVTTTGIYCKPSCGSRAAKPEHIAFYANPAEAETAGYRPCKRCKPNQPSLAAEHLAKIADVCRFIETAEHHPTLQELSVRANMSRYHLHRLFKATTGLTPKAYANAHRAECMRRELNTTDTVTDAIYSAGYHSSSRFYEASNQVLGMTPSTYRAKGRDANIHFALGECFLGSILVAKSERGICAILLGDDPATLIEDIQTKFSSASLVGGDETFEQWVAQVVGFIEAPKVGLHLPLDIQGTAFQQRVWQALQQIPMGKTVSYTDIAQQMGLPKSVRAIASACAANTLAVAIPCHRVIRLDGGLSGYRWGIERKEALLKREQEQGE
ncbi:MAG: bifunctional DNA-binding transcriptional regulator/O6-methylguanine-DNA methyltransferase Ada [Pseudomonadota bacterium]